MTSPRYVEPPDPLLPTLPAGTESSIVLTIGPDAGQTARVRTTELTRAVEARVSSLESRVGSLESQVSNNTSQINNLIGLYQWHDQQIIDLRERVEALENA